MNTKVKLLIVSCSLTFLTTNVFAVANFSGHWLANSGKLSSTIGLSSDCSKVEIIINQSETQIVTQMYNSECKMFNAKWGPITQTIKDGKIYEDGTEVGTITEDTLITISNSGTYKHAYNLKLKTNAAGHTTLDSYYGSKGAIGAIVTEATHEKVNP